MEITYVVSCSNCGNLATRRYFTSNEVNHSQCPKGRVIQTECPVCDYLMVMCSLSGNVIEAYDSSTSAMTQNIDRDRVSDIKLSRMVTL
ncbi:MAG: hypothetical protein Tsb0014_22590 [Pleurocapsa sp.]